MVHLTAIVGLGLLCGLWAVVQLSGDGDGGCRGCREKRQFAAMAGQSQSCGREEGAVGSHCGQ